MFRNYRSLNQFFTHTLTDHDRSMVIMCTRTEVSTVGTLYDDECLLPTLGGERVARIEEAVNSERAEA